MNGDICVVAEFGSLGLMKKDKGSVAAKKIPAQILVAVSNPRLLRSTWRTRGSTTPPVPAALHMTP